MKLILSVFILAIIFTSPVFSQEETLLGSGEITHGGYGGPVIKYTQINGEPGVLVGGRGGWIINHSFVIGLGGYGLVNNIKTDYTDFYNSLSGKPRLNLGYGGLELEYIYQSDQAVHFSVCALIGAGAVSYINKMFDDYDYDDWDDWDSPHDAFFVFEPGANVELNIISFLRINAGVSYRFISDVRFEGLENNDLDGPSAVLTLKFGKF